MATLKNAILDLTGTYSVSIKLPAEFSAGITKFVAADN